MYSIVRLVTLIFLLENAFEDRLFATRGKLHRAVFAHTVCTQMTLQSAFSLPQIE